MSRSAKTALAVASATLVVLASTRSRVTAQTAASCMDACRRQLNECYAKTNYSDSQCLEAYSICIYFCQAGAFLKS